jgi:hypothetical protein
MVVSLLLSPFKVNAQVADSNTPESTPGSAENFISEVSSTEGSQDVAADLKPDLSVEVDSVQRADGLTTLSPKSSEMSPDASAPSDTLDPAVDTVTQDPSIPSDIGQPPSLQTEPTSPDQKPFVPQSNAVKPSARYSPSITLLTPSGYGKSWGQVSVGGSFQSRARYVDETDAAFGFGFGLGNAKTAVGLDVNVFVADVTSFDRGGVGFKLHRQFPNQLAIAVGVNNALTWGEIDGGISPFGVVTKGFQLREDTRAPFSQLYVSGGAGTGRYRSEDDIANRRNSVGVFGGIALRVVQPVNFIAEWSGQDLSLGFSILPFPKVPIVFSPMVTDVTGTAGDGPRFTFAVGMGFTF